MVQGRAGWGWVGTCRLSEFEADVSLAAGWVCDDKPVRPSARLGGGLLT